MARRFPFAFYCLTLAAAGWGAGVAWAGRDAPGGGKRAADPLAVGSDLQLFVDRALIGRLGGAALRLHAPQRQEVVFRFDAPWEGAQSGYVTVMPDGERFRLYYRGGGATGGRPFGRDSDRQPERDTV
ncbi:MAG: hypothetical protein FJX77_18080 [Armatimonadetes bacterium]|nr:hypothetical protein [Armatimonadota bacterium]